MASGGQLVTAFYDESGVFGPQTQGRHVAIGMVVIHSRHIKECNVNWWEMIGGHFPSVQPATLLPLLGIEAKLSELQDMENKLMRNGVLKNSQKCMVDNGLNSGEKIRSLIQNIYRFLEKPIVPVKYLAVCADKDEYWHKFYQEKYNRWKYLSKANGGAGDKKAIGKEMMSSLMRNMYHFLTQRLHLLSADDDKFEFSDSFIVGDQTSSFKILLEKQSAVQAGFDKYGNLPSIVNKSWFGDSRYEPCLQIADSVAYAVLNWAEKRDSALLKTLLPHFRGYPEVDKIIGKGIVCCPDTDCFPSLC